MKFIFASVALAFFALASASPTKIEKREVSFGDPDSIIDFGDQFEVNYGSTGGHDNACPGHFQCFIPYSNGSPHHDGVGLGNPDNFVDEGDRFRLNYGSTSGHDNACPGHFICYIYHN